MTMTGEHRFRLPQISWSNMATFDEVVNAKATDLILKRIRESLFGSYF